MITKELFSSVMGVKIGTYYCGDILTEERLWIDDTQSTSYICWDRMSEHNEINIYEFAHKCKEWAYKNNGMIVSKNHRSWKKISLSDNQSDYTDDWEAIGYVYTGNPANTLTNEFICDTEPEAIFKACQWILDNKETK